MCGGRSRSSSTSTSNVTNTSIDKRIGTGEGSIVATEGSTVNVDSIDAGVVEKALIQTLGFADKVGNREAEAFVAGIE